MRGGHRRPFFHLLKLGGIKEKDQLERRERFRASHAVGETKFSRRTAKVTVRKERESSGLKSKKPRVPSWEKPGGL